MVCTCLAPFQSSGGAPGSLLLKYCLKLLFIIIFDHRDNHNLSDCSYTMGCPFKPGLETDQYYRPGLNNKGGPMTQGK